jgi:glycosyltransferase involved in cell wall biosynthesis
MINAGRRSTGACNEYRYLLTNESRYRVLLIAEAANPEWASQPLIGWSLSRALAKVVDVHLVTQARNRDAILRAGLVEGRDFSIIDNERYAYPLYKLSTKLNAGAGLDSATVTAWDALAYYSFESDLWRQFASRLIAREFDLVHRVTPLTPTSQSIIAKRLAKLGIPFVIGPLNGGAPWPKNFSGRRYAQREWLSYIRPIYKLMPAYRSTNRCSAAIIVASKHTMEQMPRWVATKCVYIPENAVDPDRFGIPRDHVASIPLKVAFVGRLVPYKGADIVIKAAVEFLKYGQVELHIFGDGPQRGQLETLVDALHVRDSVLFHGVVPQAQLQYKLRTCDVMAFPSVREVGGAVVMEAMALGVTPIVADYAGPAEIVDDKTGIKIPFHDEKSLLEGMRRAIADIIRSPEILDSLGSAARQKVLTKLTWDAKAQQILAIYRAVLRGNKELSSFNIFMSPSSSNTPGPPTSSEADLWRIPIDITKIP